MRKVIFILMALFTTGFLASCSSLSKKQIWQVENVFYTENSSSKTLLLAALLGEQTKPQLIELKNDHLKFVYSNNEVFETTILNKKVENQKMVLQTSDGDMLVFFTSNNSCFVAINNTFYEVRKLA